MYVQFELTNGELMQSDPFDLISSGFSPVEFDAIVQSIVDTLEDFRSMGHLGLDIGGRKRYFNPEHVLWAELVF